MVIEHFRSIGHDMCSVDLVLACIFGIAIIVVRSFGKVIPAWMWAMQLSFLVAGFIHVPSLLQPLVLAAPTVVACFNDRAKLKSGWDVKTKQTVLTALVLCAIPIVMGAVETRQITLTGVELQAHNRRDEHVLARNGLQLSVENGNLLTSRTWHVTSGESEINISGEELFVSSSGHFYHGDDIVRIVAHWARPSNQTPNDQRALALRRRASSY